MEKELLAKQLLYRSTHRGCKETDFLIGEYAKSDIAKMEQADLDLFSEFIEENDWELYDWLLGKIVGPEKYDHFLAAIRKFHKI